MRDTIKETIYTLADCLSHIRKRYLYELEIPENIDNLRGECMCAIDKANQILGRYHIEAVLNFEHTPGNLYVGVDFKDTITGYNLDLSDFMN